MELNLKVHGHEVNFLTATAMPIERNFMATLTQYKVNNNEETNYL